MALFACRTGTITTWDYKYWYVHIKTERQKQLFKKEWYDPVKVRAMIETDTSKGLEQQVLRKCEILKQKQGIRQLMRSSNSVQLSFLETLLSSSTHKIWKV
jgi:hypothetical protein